MIRAIIFDCFGVLYRDNIAMLYDAVPESQRQALQDIIHATDHGFLSREEYYESIAELGGKTPEEIRAIEQRQHSRDENVIAYARSLKGQYKIGLLSNIDSGTMAKLFPLEQREELFDAFVISGEVGLVKPTVEIFELAAARLGVRPEECVMIDDLAKNVEGAKQAGLHGLLFTSLGGLKADLPQLIETANA